MFDSEFRIWLTSASEKYRSCKKLLAHSKDDPPTEPYRSKYKAKEILVALATEVENKWKLSENLLVTILHSLFKYEVGIIDLETEEYSSGCEFLTSSWEEVQPLSGRPECCILALSILNQLGILWSGRGECNKARDYLLEAEKLYNAYKASTNVCPYAFEDLFAVENAVNRDWNMFEKTFTYTLYYLAQVYEHLNENDKAAKCCHRTLKRQLESGCFEPNEWAINSATLSQYFMQRMMFDEARHLLSCSAATLVKYESRIEKEINKTKEDMWDELSRSKAEVSWCWVKYCINLMEESKEISESGKNESDDIDQYCRLSEDEDVIRIEKQVSSAIASYEDAKQVFLFAQNHISEAKLYYTLNQHTNNYVQIMQDHSKLYKCLIQYDSDKSRQCKMHKRRIDMLEDLLSKLNIRYYLSVCRQLRFELGETYYEMIDLKFKIANSTKERLSAKNIKKINSLIKHCTNHFVGFIDSLKNRDGTVPEVFSDDLVRPTLIAHFFLAGLYSKYIEIDTNKEMYNLSKSEEHYQFIVDYAEKNPEHAQQIEKELPVVKDMIELMPMKRLHITDTTIY